MDKRRNSRYAIRLNALVHPSVGRSWLCTIQDFCAGGMLLVEPDHGRIRKSAASINSGDSVGIHFTVPTGAKDKHFRLSGRIVRVMEGGIGINFPRGVDEDALTALLYYGNSAPVVSNVSSQTDMLRTTPKKCGVKAEAGATAKASRKTGRNAIGKPKEGRRRRIGSNCLLLTQKNSKTGLQLPISFLEVKDFMRNF